jgi:hypothetical protein
MNFSTVWMLTTNIAEISTLFLSVRWLIREHGLTQTSLGWCHGLITFIVGLLFGALAPLAIMMFTLPEAHRYTDKSWVPNSKKFLIFMLMVGGICKILVTFHWVALYTREVFGLEPYENRQSRRPSP